VLDLVRYGTETLYTKQASANTPKIHHNTGRLTITRKNADATIETHRAARMIDESGKSMSERSTKIMISPKNTARSFREPISESDDRSAPVEATTPRAKKITSSSTVSSAAEMSIAK
jgi:hypothetical protein